MNMRFDFSYPIRRYITQVINQNKSLKNLQNAQWQNKETAKIWYLKKNDDDKTKFF